MNNTKKSDNRTDTDKVSRRKMVGDSVKTLAGLYAAPATMSLLTASRATAQSGQGLVTVFNRTSNVLTVSFTSPSGADSKDIAKDDSDQMVVICPSPLTFSNGSKQVDNSCSGGATWVITD